MSRALIFQLLREGDVIYESDSLADIQAKRKAGDIIRSHWLGISAQRRTK